MDMKSSILQTCTTQNSKETNKTNMNSSSNTRTILHYLVAALRSIDRSIPSHCVISIDSIALVRYLSYLCYLSYLSYLSYLCYLCYLYYLCYCPCCISSIVRSFVRSFVRSIDCCPSILFVYLSTFLLSFHYITWPATSARLLSVKTIE